MMKMRSSLANLGLLKILSSKISREVNTDVSNVHMEDKSTNTEPLIVLSPDEVIEMKDGLTIATFTKNLQIFVDTLQSDIVFCKPKLSRPDSPNTQIGILNILPSFHKDSQARKPVDKEETLIRTPNTQSQENQKPFCNRDSQMDILGPLFTKKADSPNPEASATKRSFSDYSQYT